MFKGFRRPKQETPSAPRKAVEPEVTWHFESQGEAVRYLGERADASMDRVLRSQPMTSYVALSDRLAVLAETGDRLGMQGLLRNFMQGYVLEPVPQAPVTVILPTGALAQPAAVPLITTLAGSDDPGASPTPE